MSATDVAVLADASPASHRYSAMHFQTRRRAKVAAAEVVRGQEAPRAEAPENTTASAVITIDDGTTAVEADAPSAPAPTEPTARAKRARKRS